MLNTTIFSIFWVSLALITALIFSKIMKKIHFPNVTGYLLGGIIIGPWVIGLIDQNTFTTTINSLSWISEIALGFIAFSIGGSFQLKALKKVGKRATIISIAEALGGSIIVIGALFLAYALGLKDQGLTPSMILILGSIACATAPAATLLVINQYRAKGPLTETLIPVVAFDDAVALIAFSILFSIAKILQNGGAFSVLEALVIPLLEIIFSILIGGLFGFILSLMTRWFTSRHNRLVAVIATTLLCVAISNINTQTTLSWSFSFQLSSLLTVMSCGAIYVNLAKGVSKTNEFLDKFTVPIFMLFFIISGAKLDFGIFKSSSALLVILIALIYLISRVIGKVSGATLGSTITKCETPIKKYLGFTLIPQAGVALGLASKAQLYLDKTSSSDLGGMLFTIIIVSTMIYELTGPLITKWALSKAGEINIQ